MSSRRKKSRSASREPLGLGPQGGHGLAATSIVNVFEALRVGATLWDGGRWRDLHVESNVIDFEIEHGAEAQRFRHNDRSVARVIRERRAVLNEHAGFMDLFVPISVEGRIRAILITGPFATARPSATSILEGWRALTGRQGHAADPEFLHYVSVSLSTLVLEPELLRSYRRLLDCFALLVSGDDRNGAVLNEADALRTDLDRARFVERVWDLARAFVDTRTSRRWSSSYQSSNLATIGLSQAVDEVVVGLVVNRRPVLDPVDEIVRRDAFHRACVHVAHQAHDAASGRIGDHGVTFLSALGPHKQRGRRALVDLAMEAASMAKRRFGLGLHLGISSLSAGPSLAERYASALQAAESASSQGAALVEATSAPRRLPLEEMRRRFGAMIEESPQSLPAQFDHYLDAVARHTRYRVEPARAHLEAGFERIAESLFGSGTLEAKGLSDLYDGLEQAARDAHTVADLSTVYRRAVVDLCAAVTKPVPAHRDRSIRRAIEHIRVRFTEPLTLASVARVAGFAPSHFSTLFKRFEGTTYSQYVCRLRLERARELLARTELDLGRIALLSGFRSREYFARVFRSVVGMTPMESRRQAWVPLPRVPKKKS